MFDSHFLANGDAILSKKGRSVAKVDSVAAPVFLEAFKYADDMHSCLIRALIAMERKGHNADFIKDILQKMEG